MKIKFSEEFKEFVIMIEGIRGTDSKIDLEKTYDVVRKEMVKGEEIIYVISNGKEERLSEKVYIIVED